MNPRSEPVAPESDAELVPLWVRRASAYSWRFLVIAAAVVATLWVVGRALFVAIPVFAAILIARALVPVRQWLERRGLKRGLAAALVVAGFVLVLLAGLGAIGASVSSEVDGVGEAMSDAVDDIEDWLVDDAPFDVDREQVEQWRTDIGEAISDALRSSRESGAAAEGAVLAAEVLAGLVLTFVVAFFVVKDGERMWAAVVRTVPRGRRHEAARYGGRAWNALGGYLRGAALLGVVEAIVIGIAMFIMGADLITPVMAVTLVAAFVPIVGAVFAGAVAVLVTLATAGTGAALIVLIVAVLVQQFDNDLLAPVIYGRSLQLPPLAILLGVAVGAALFGLVGAFLAVPVLAVGLGVLDEARTIRRGDPPPTPTPD